MTIKKTPLFLGTGIVLLAALDQASKWLASVRLVEPVLLFPGVSLAYRQNTGIAWSIQMPYLLLMALNFALVAVFIRIAVKYFALDRPISRIAIMLV